VDAQALDLRLVLVAVGVLLPLAVLRLPVSLIQRYGVLLLALVAVANGLWLSLYAFGEDDYTNNGESRWQTHNSSGSHLYYVVALSFELLLVATQFRFAGGRNFCASWRRSRLSLRYFCGADPPSPSTTIEPERG